MQLGPGCLQVLGSSPALASSLPVLQLCWSLAFQALSVSLTAVHAVWAPRPDPPCTVSEQAELAEGSCPGDLHSEEKESPALRNLHLGAWRSFTISPKSGRGGLHGASVPRKWLKWKGLGSSGSSQGGACGGGGRCAAVWTEARLEARDLGSYVPGSALTLLCDLE